MTMRVIRTWEQVHLPGVVLTIGNFDGVHRGHQEILARGKRRAQAAGTQLAVLTFDPHPLAILSPQRVPPTLTPLPEKLRRLEDAGADGVVIVSTTPEFLSLSAEQFIQQVIVERFAPVAMVEGASFGFGQRRQGDVHMLGEAGRRLGFEVEVVEPVRVALGGHRDGEISSSLVRELLRSGEVYQAARCLGRPFALLGQVERGAGRGQSLGYPTVNVATVEQLIPGEGVYAARAELPDRCLPAAVNIGASPTFDRHQVVIEAHLLDYQGDLYGRAIRIELLDWIRDQARFPSVEALREQIGRDVTTVRAIVADYEQRLASHASPYTS